MAQGNTLAGNSVSIFPYSSGNYLHIYTLAIYVSLPTFSVKCVHTALAFCTWILFTYEEVLLWTSFLEVILI